MYSVKFTPTATDDLGRLNKSIAQRMFTKIRWLAGQWKGVYKLRVDDYRVLYTFSTAESSITVHFVRHRRKVYKIK